MVMFRNALPVLGDRRFVVKGLAAVALGSLLVSSIGTAAWAQNTKVSVDDLMAKQALPDIVQGKADAPVTVVEYASMTCTHCAAFHTETYPTLLKKYVETGKVKFILREFPLDPLATAGFMLARCEGPEKRSAVVDLLFTQQKNWAFVDKPLEALAGILKQTGMSKDAFETCLKDQKLYDQVNEVRDGGSQKFGVTATPTFYFNGTKVSGEITPDTLAKILDPLLKS
jgi:protein-disulfide isomerase